MEGGKKQSGSSSLATELFGEKDCLTGSSSSGVFDALFATPKGLGRESQYQKEKRRAEKQAWNPKTGVSDANVVDGEGESKSTESYFVDEKVVPFNYNNSIYYGGQDVYTRPSKPAQNPVFTTFKDGSEDDSGGASRGHWWRGSLYY